MKPIEKLEPWHYYGEYSIHALTPPERKINELIDAVNEILKPEERQPYHCPVCGEKGDTLKEKTGQGCQAGDYYIIDVVFDTKRIYACPKCHCLFWEEV